MFILFCFLIPFVLSCSNYCSGHGTCESKDMCKCYYGWGAADCSQRACPYSVAFVDLQIGDLDHGGKGVDDTVVKTEWYPKQGRAEDSTDLVGPYYHRYAECSNTGVCNRRTGDCSCFAGYEGSACQRAVCPSGNELKCSGHGDCMPSRANVPGWETEKIFACACDYGWSGNDCNKRLCPAGMDPILGGAIKMGYEFDLPHKHYRRELQADPMVPKAIYPHIYQVVFGGINYQSTLVSAVSNTDICQSLDGKPTGTGAAVRYQNEIRRAIQSIPPLSQSTVTITCETDISTDNSNNENARKLNVRINLEYADYDEYSKSEFTLVEYVPDESACTTFESESTNHPDNTLQPYDCEKGDGESVYYTPVEKFTEKRKVGAEPTVCSTRGLCNSESGLCECFKGYYGAACENALSINVNI